MYINKKYIFLNLYLDLQYSRLGIRFARAVFTLSILQGVVHARLLFRRLKS